MMPNGTDAAIHRDDRRERLSIAALLAAGGALLLVTVEASSGPGLRFVSAAAAIGAVMWAIARTQRRWTEAPPGPEHARAALVARRIAEIEAFRHAARALTWLGAVLGLGLLSGALVLLAQGEPAAVTLTTVLLATAMAWACRSQGRDADGWARRRLQELRGPRAGEKRREGS